MIKFHPILSSTETVRKGGWFPPQEGDLHEKSAAFPPSSFSSRMRFDVSKDGQMQNPSLRPSFSPSGPRAIAIRSTPIHRRAAAAISVSVSPSLFSLPKQLGGLAPDRGGLETAATAAEKQAGRESEIDRLKPFFPRT